MDHGRLEWSGGLGTEEGHDFCHGVLLCRGADGGNVVTMVGRGDVVVVAHVSGEEGAVIGESWLLEHDEVKVCVVFENVEVVGCWLLVVGGVGWGVWVQS